MNRKNVAFGLLTIALFNFASSLITNRRDDDLPSQVLIENSWRYSPAHFVGTASQSSRNLTPFFNETQTNLS